MYIALADIHGETEVLERILREHRGVRAALVAGDITNFGGEKEARRALSVFEEFASETSVYFVAGNCDSERARAAFLPQPGYLERRSAAFSLKTGGVLQIIGAGGGIFHTGLTPYELRDEELGANLAAAAATLESSASEVRNLIVLTHTPPRNTLADLRLSRHLGSSEFEAFLFEREPLVWVCGHIHESRSVSREGRTLIVNPGPASHGSYAIIAIEEGPRGVHAAAELRAL